jgi:tetratricopeptide (TPR) repeat protein
MKGKNERADGSRRTPEGQEGDAYLQLAERLEAEGLLREAEEQYRGAVARGSTRAYGELARLLRGTDRLEEAEALYRRAVDQRIDELLLEYGNLVAEQTGREAEAIYRRAIGVGERYAHANLGRLLEDTGRIEEPYASTAGDWLWVIPWLNETMACS